MQVGEIKLGKGKIYRVRGPALLYVKEGKIFALGREFLPNSTLKVSKGRVYALKAIENTVLNVSTGLEGRFEEAKPGEEAIEEWIKNSKIILEDQVKRIIVLGGTDCGKSTFITFLVNMALDKNMRIAVIDADVGQNDIGPPATVSLAIPEKQLDHLRSLKPYRMFFIGSITPYGVEDLLISSILRLTEIAEKDNVEKIIVNTDGWLEAVEAVMYKTKLIYYLNADAIIEMYRENLEKIYHKIEKICKKSYKVAIPKAIHKRSKSERSFLRSQGYMRFLKDAQVRTIDLENVPILNSILFNGIQLNIPALEKDLNIKIVHAEKLYNSSVVVLSKKDTRHVNRILCNILKEKIGVKYLKVVKEGEEKGLYVGLVGEKAGETGVGIIESIDFRRKLARIKTSFTKTIRGIILSRIKLSEDFSERILGAPPL